MATISQSMTEEEFLALPDDDGIERELIRGELRERPTMTTRGFAHSAVMNRVAQRLTNWSDLQPEPRGTVVVGDAKVRLRQDPPTFVGVDVAYIGAGSKPEASRRARFISGRPILAVEILSPNDRHEDVSDKVVEYLEAGVPLVWIVDTLFSTVTVYRPDAKPQLFNADQILTAELFLPGFQVTVADLFEDLD
jgi:Uma2 family endonuclease